MTPPADLRALAPEREEEIRSLLDPQNRWAGNRPTVGAIYDLLAALDHERARNATMLDDRDEMLAFLRAARPLLGMAVGHSLGARADELLARLDQT